MNNKKHFIAQMCPKMNWNTAVVKSIMLLDSFYKISSFWYLLTDTHIRLTHTQKYEWIVGSSGEIAHWNRLSLKASVISDDT